MTLIKACTRRVAARLHGFNWQTDNWSREISSSKFPHLELSLLLSHSNTPAIRLCSVNNKSSASNSASARIKAHTVLRKKLLFNWTINTWHFSNNVFKVSEKNCISILITRKKKQSHKVNVLYGLLNNAIKRQLSQGSLKRKNTLS